MEDEKLYKVKRLIWEYLTFVLRIPIANDNDVTELAIKILKLDKPPKNTK